MKMIGYILAIIGLIGLAASLIKEVQDPIFKALNLSASQISSTYLMIGSIIVIVIGIFIIMKKGGKGTKASGEVPIYHGNKIVGYRRH